MIEKFRFYRYSDETINRSLYYLRANIIRAGGEGREHVDALLRLRGCDPEAVDVPRKYRRKFRNGHLRRLLLDTLREAPCNTDYLATMMLEHWPHVSRRDRKNRLMKCLRQMEAKGLVRLDGRMWAVGRQEIAAKEIDLDM